MITKYYHATDYNNVGSILLEGIKTSWDGVIYLCTSASDAAKFCAIHGIKHILVVEVELDDSEVKESFDHSEEFFKCKAYTCARIIDPEEFRTFIEYKL